MYKKNHLKWFISAVALSSWNLLDIYSHTHIVYMYVYMYRCVYYIFCLLFLTVLMLLAFGSVKLLSQPFLKASLVY